MERGQDTFKVFAPVQLIKATDAQGNKKMRLAGIASTSSKDADGEYLDPNGFELDYFMKYGYMNWNHQTSKDPLALIGKPTQAVKKAEGLHVDCELFDNNPRAKEVYQLAEILEAQGHQLGFSIEGKVIERDKTNPKIVKKAKITGCAITPNPKNRDTIAEIIKGEHFSTLSAYDDEDEETREKALSAGSASGQAVSKESLDNRVKKLTYGDHNDDTKKFFLTKGDVMAKIFEDHPGISLETGEELYTLILNIEKSIVMTKTDVTISPEAIEKAYATLGLTKGEESSEEASAEATESGAADENAELEKGFDYKSMKKADLKKMVGEMSAHLKKMEEGDEEGDDDDDEDEDDVEKGKLKGDQHKLDVDKDGKIEAEDLAKLRNKGISQEALNAAITVMKASGLPFSFGEEIEKGESDEFGANSNVMELLKGELDAIQDSNDARFEAATTLIKGMQEDLTILREELDSYASGSAGAKSVTHAHSIEKSWDTDLEKGLGEGNGSGAQLSVTRDKKRILDMLEETYFSKGELVDKQLANDTMVFESAGQLSKGIIDTMAEKGYELVG